MNPLLSIFTCLTIAAGCCAMSVSDIPGLSGNAGLSEAAKIVSDSIEPYLWKEKNDVIPRDSLKKRLNGIIKELNSKDPAGTETLLFKALLWHYLSKLDVDSAIIKCKKITGKLIASHPDLCEAKWLQSLNLIQDGQIYKGLKNLDSINRSGAVKNPDILYDYVKVAASVLLPEVSSGKDSVIHLFPSINKYSSFAPDSEESVPQDRMWRTYTGLENGNLTLSFSFGCRFLLKPQISLKFNIAGYPENPPLLKVNADTALLNRVFGPPAFDVDFEPWKAELTVVVDISKKQLSLYEYLFNIVFKKFDSIEVSDDARRLHGLSLRCHNYPGNFYAFIVFDLPAGRYGMKKLSSHKGSTESDAVTARYLLCLKTKQNVEDKAEELLAQILSSFN